MLDDPEYREAFDEYCAELSEQLSIMNQRMLTTNIFADKEIQGLFDQYIAPPKESVLGDYAKGSRAYLLGQADNPCRDISLLPNQTDEHYMQRIKCWQMGYAEASEDARYVKLRAICEIIREAD